MRALLSSSARRHLVRLAELAGDAMLLLLVGFLVGLIVAGMAEPVTTPTIP